MILNEVNSNAYIYFKLLAQNEGYPYMFSHIKEGTVLRFPIETLREWIWKHRVRDNLTCFEFEPHPDATPFDYEPSKLYQRVRVIKDINLEVNMDFGDLLLINEWLWSKLNSTERPLMTPENQLSFLFGSPRSKSPLERNKNNLSHTRLLRYDGTEWLGSDIFDSEETRHKYLTAPELPALPSGDATFLPEDKLIDCYQFGNEEVIIVPLRKGDILDFHNPVINLLFLNQSWIRLLSNMSPVSEEEKQKQFKEEFEGWIPEAERRYFKLHDDIKIKRLRDIVTNEEVWQAIMNHNPEFRNLLFDEDWRYSHVDNFDRDKEGNIRYIWTSDEPVAELEILKIATRVSAEEGRKHYIHEVETQKEQEHQRELERQANQYLKSHQGRYYKLIRKLPNLTPIEFMLREKSQEEEMKRTLVRRMNNALNTRINSLK